MLQLGMPRELVNIVFVVMEPLTWLLLLILFLVGVVRPFFNYLFDIERVRAVKRIRRLREQQDARSRKKQEQQEMTEAESSGE